MTPIPRIFILGPPNTGKTVIVKDFLTRWGVNFEYFDCRNKLSGEQLGKSIDDQLKNIRTRRQGSQKKNKKDMPFSSTPEEIQYHRAFIVLDNIELIDPSLFASLSWFDSCACFIFIGRNASVAMRIPCIPIYFPTYTNDDLILIILQRLQSVPEAHCGGPENLANFVKYVVKVQSGRQGI